MIDLMREYHIQKAISEQFICSKKIFFIHPASLDMSIRMTFDLQILKLKGPHVSGDSIERAFLRTLETGYSSDATSDSRHYAFPQIGIIFQ